MDTEEVERRKGPRRDLTPSNKTVFNLMVFLRENLVVDTKILVTKFNDNVRHVLKSLVRQNLVSRKKASSGLGMAYYLTESGRTEIDRRERDLSGLQYEPRGKGKMTTTLTSLAIPEPVRRGANDNLKIPSLIQGKPVLLGDRTENGELYSRRRNDCISPCDFHSGQAYAKTLNSMSNKE